MLGKRSTVVIPAYQRSQELLNRCQEVLSWPRLKNLVISVDGPRATATAAELSRREDVIEASKSVASLNTNVDMYIWDDNRGVNTHTQRFIRKLIPSSKGILVIEDDVSVSFKTLDFLADNYDCEGATGAAAHVSHSHLDIKATDAQRTLFPIQWGLAISHQAMAIYLSVMDGSPILRKPIQKSIREHYGHLLTTRKLESLTQWWFNHFFFCLRHENWADALIQYSVMAAGGHYRVPAQSLIIDDSTLFDERAITPRIPIKNDLTCQFAISDASNGEYFCIKCELANSRLKEATIRNLLGATKHRRNLMLKESLNKLNI
jgi:hypothetical protein